MLKTSVFTWLITVISKKFLILRLTHEVQYQMRGEKNT